MKVAEHEHPLTLIDLQVQYQQEEDVEEDEEEAGDRIAKEVFDGVKCKRCYEEIHIYHRYLYKCMECDFSIHKFCGELPERYGIDVKCAVEAGKKMIHHPSHPHVLTCVSTKPILSECSACGKEHKGVFYTCTTCSGVMIHGACAFLPETLLIQKTTDDAFHHSHPLTISYSFPWIDQDAKHWPNCRVCGVGFRDTWNIWIYKCEDCMYYAHLHCAASTTTTEPFMSIFSPPGLGKTVKNYKDADHPHLLHLPFPDETHSMPRHLFFQESGTSDHLVNPLIHASHQHPLTLVDCNGQTSSASSSEVIDSWLLKCHDPMKKTQFLCNGCLRPITSTMPFYTCAQPICNFALHEWCTRLPPKIENHPKHPQHPLLLIYSQVLPHHFFGVFRCDVCGLQCNGFAYCCDKCGYDVDVTCGLLPPEITHESHPNHLLSLSVQLEYNNKRCHMCLRYVDDCQLSFRCKSCDIHIHPECALLLPKAITHKYDKHPMNLSYLPIENHKSEYFCEICEEDLNPHYSFYHCQECAQSVHAACAPLILQSETETYSRYN